MFVKVAASLLAVFLAVTSARHIGATADADINCPEVQKILQFAVAQYNAHSDSIYTSQVVKVIKLQVQAVIGVKYIFTVVMVKTYPKKPTAGYTCTIRPKPNFAKPYECILIVWKQPWSHTMKLMFSTC
ncbi:cystatin-like [Neoarius graeffei]|uniref:cystatin-like n=1 Tax=Neoarius graeffei TaxID=443677 RepID=UPI00298C3419|nr:cystatin-like [Neoarius graeffei]